MTLFRILPLCLTLFLSTPLLAAPDSRVSILRTKPKLNAPLTLSARQEPLEDLIPRIAASTGAVLEASPETASERVTLFVKARPAQETLAVIAEHLDYSWVARTRSGVCTLALVQDLAAKQREAKLRGAGVGVLRALLEKRVAAANTPEVRRLRRLPLPERLQQLEVLQEELYGPLVAEMLPGALDPATFFQRKREGPPLLPETQKRLTAELRNLRLATPEADDTDTDAIAVTLLETLAPREEEQLWAGARLSFSYPSEPGRLPLPKAAAERIAAPGLGHQVSRGESPLEYEPFHALERLRVSLHLDLEGPTPELRVRLRALGSFGGNGEPITRAEYVEDRPVRDLGAQGQAAPSGVDEAVKRMTQSFAVKASPGGAPGTWSLEETLEQIAAQIPYPVIADGYWRSNAQIPGLGASQPVGQGVEKISRCWSLSTRMHKGWITFRDSIWPYRRSMEPPAGLVRRAQDSRRRWGMVSLGPTIEASALSADAVRVLMARLDIQPGIQADEGSLDDDLRESRAVLRLLGALTKQQKERLRTGASLSFASLAPLARTRAEAAFEADARLVYGIEQSDPDNEPYQPGVGFLYEDQLEAAWRRGDLSMTREPVSWVKTGAGIRPIEDLEAIRKELRDTGANPDSAHVVKGHRIAVSLSVPGLDPIIHTFLEPASE